MNALRVEEGLNLVLRIQSETKADASFEYSGHADGITIRVYPEGWRADGCRCNTYTTIGGYRKQTWDGMMMLNETEYKNISDLLSAVKREAF